ncbi:leucine-rich repeat protein [Kineothrix sp. MSJ-39]|uniref:leucine-rich repeat protein n=1 Tax=Kineothrix sp. MSJ-39 TaxID=2841533 RepID=UPI001C1072D1|nr:leucine-rich repeat protein [Kineothrix sp. MSJ-39]MBU5430527.1 leucine-rich repeat protein [Kineothrix sp. MSJ-39]
MKGNGRIRKQLQAYLCMLVLSVQSLTPVMQVSAEEVTTVDVSAQTAQADETEPKNGGDAATVSEPGITQGIPTCDITTGTPDEADGWSFSNAADQGYQQVTIHKNGTYRLTGSNAETGYNFYIKVESGLDDVKLIFDDVVICNTYNGSPAPAQTTEAPAVTSAAPVRTTEAPSQTTEAPVGTTEAPVETTEAPASVETTEAPASVETTEAPSPVQTTENPPPVQAEEVQTQADAAGMVPSVQASGTSQATPVYGPDYVNIQAEQTPLIIGSDTKVILQGKATLQGKKYTLHSVWGDEGSCITFEEGIFNISWVSTTVIKFENALVFNCTLLQQDYSEKEWEQMGFTMFSENLDLESVWISGQKYDVSGLGIQGRPGWISVAMNLQKAKTIEFLFDGGILYSYRYSIAKLQYQQVAPMQEHCTVIYEEEGYEVGRCYCVPGGNVELWPSNREAQMQYMVKETGENFDGRNVTQDMTVQLLPDTAYGIDVTINGEVKQFPKGSSLPEGYCYIETDNDGKYKDTYDCRVGKEKVVINEPMTLLALQYGDNADHPEYLIDSAESLKTYVFLSKYGHIEGENVRAADLKLTQDITVDFMLEYFEGSLDGQNHTITLALTEDKTHEDSIVGLFQNLNGTVKNLTVDGSMEVEDESITVGGLAGYVGEQLLISNCRSDVNIRVSGKNIYAGGLVGRTDGSVQISDSSMNGTVTAEGGGSQMSYIGGMIGCIDWGRGVIERSHVTGFIDVGSIYTIASSIANESHNADGMEIRNSYASGEIRRGRTGDSRILIYGLAFAEVREAGAGGTGNKKGTLTNCYDYSVVRDSTDGTLDDHITAGGPLQTDNCYYATEQCAEQTGMTGVTEEQIKNGALCYMLNQGKTKESVWYQTIGADLYPVTESEGHAVVYGKTDSETEEMHYGNAEGTVVPAEQHKYQYVKMYWEREEEPVKACGIFRCENCKKQDEKDAEVTVENIEPDCENTGKIIYTATVIRDGKTYTDKTEEVVPATGHKYGKWELNISGKGVRVCQNPGCGKKELCDHGITITALDGTPANASAENAKENYNNLFDHNMTTKWCLHDCKDAYVIFETSVSIAPEEYILTTANDNSNNPGRNPKSWKLYAMNADTAPSRYAAGWTELASVENDAKMEDRNYTEYRFYMTKPAEKYRYFKLEIEGPHENGDGIMQLSEIRLLPEVDTRKESVSANDCILTDYEATICNICGCNLSDKQETEKHDYVNDVIVPDIQLESEATCTKKAAYYAICSKCHKLNLNTVFEYGETKAHSIGSVEGYRWNTDNSCDLRYTCEECGKLFSEKMDVTKEVLQERTCMQNGKLIYRAVLEENGKEIGKTEKSVKIPAYGHALAGDKIEFAETTGTDGKRTVTAKLPIHCSNDNCTYEQLIPATVEEGKNTATCTADGVIPYTAKVIWNAQTYTDIYQVKTTKQGHKLKNHVPQKEATQTAEGVKEYYTCVGCDQKFADRTLTKPVTDAELVIPKLTPAPSKKPVPSPQPSSQPSQKPSPQPSKSPQPEVIRQKDGSGITIINKKKKEVSYTGAKKTKTSLTVPSKVKIGKKTYQVTKIVDGAFKGNKKLKKLTIPKNCSYIGAEAFAGCTKLKTLTIKSKKLTEKTVADHAFKGISKKTVIKVPKSKVDTYRKLFREKGLNKKVKIKAI